MTNGLFDLVLLQAEGEEPSARARRRWGHGEG